jgi:exosortase
MPQPWRKVSKLADGRRGYRTIPERQAGDDSAAFNGRGRPGPRAGLVVLVILGLLAGLYGGILRDLAWQWWDDPNYTHGFLVPLFSGFLVWQRRKQLAALPPKGSWIGLPVLLAGVGALLLGDLGAENFLMRSSLIVVLTGLVLFHLGREIFRVLAFPLLFLFFMVPLPATLFYAIAFPLQSLAARNAAWTLDRLGVPVLLDGNVIHLTRLSLGVAEACSGIRSLISVFSVAVGWAALTLPGIWGMAVFVASVIPITILANAGRVVVTGLIAEWFSIEYAQGFFHTFSSWLVFVFAFVCLLGIHSVIRLAQLHPQKQTP